MTNLVQSKHQEGSSTSCLSDDCQIFGVHGAELRIPCTLGDANVIIALVTLCPLAEDMTKFALTNNARRSVCHPLLQTLKP